MTNETSWNEAHLEFLDKLKESGRTSMSGAAPFLKARFPELTTGRATRIIMHWMHTFGERHREVSHERKTL